MTVPSRHQRHPAGGAGAYHGSIRLAEQVAGVAVTHFDAGADALLQAEATDILGQLENVVTDFSAEKRGISLYNGASRCLLMRIIWKFYAGVR